MLTRGRAAERIAPRAADPRGDIDVVDDRAGPAPLGPGRDLGAADPGGRGAELAGWGAQPDRLERLRARLVPVDARRLPVPDGRHQPVVVDDGGPADLAAHLATQVHDDPTVALDDVDGGRGRRGHRLA